MNGHAIESFARSSTLALLLAAALVVTACGGDSSPTAPSQTTPANLAGSWTGWMETSNFGRVIGDAELSQSGSTVTGTWRAASATGLGWTGTFSGTATATSFSGTTTISMANPNGDGSTCTGTSAISGTATGTIRWTGAGFTGDCSGMPANLEFEYNRRA
ncbi:MAG: hypothetical protein O2930_12715 [Acidobacteria bacterium]|nr:hypothetical protein [Acidobacteriota bacterium]